MTYTSVVTDWNPAVSVTTTHPSQPSDDLSTRYASLAAVLNRALEQAARGKGMERHATTEPFERQPIVQTGQWLNSTHPYIGQVVKKAFESARLPPEHAIQEWLGIIVNAAAAVIVLESRSGR